MENNSVELLKHTFKLAYKQGKQDALDGVHICLDTLFDNLVNTEKLYVDFAKYSSFSSNKSRIKSVC